MAARRIARALCGVGLLLAPGFPVALSPTGGAPAALPDPSICTTRAPGPPVVLGQLILAQAETRPFDPKLAPKGAPASGKPPLWKNLGSMTMHVTTGSREARNYFNQGLRLAFGFNHGEARRAFQAAQQADPACALCYWGEAWVLGPNINMPMLPDAVAPAQAAAAKARAMAGPVSRKEQALIAAVAQRYAESPPQDRAPLDRAYAEAMGQVAQRYPDDDMMQVLHADALMNLSPWDYWEAGGARPKPAVAGLVPALERVLERNPRHAGAIHLYIHAVEASATPQRALPYARILGDLMPGAGHMVHMPAHIYYRLGLYRDSLEANRKAVAADERYFRESESDPVYRFAYYPHNIHFIMVSAQAAGDGRTAAEAAEKLDRVLSTDFLRKAPALQPVKAAPYFTHAQFSAPRTILALPDPGDEFVLVKAMWHYARAVAHAAEKDFAAAGKEIAALAHVEATADFAPLRQAQVPGKEVVQTARLVALGRLADARGDLAAAARAYEDAIFIEDGLAYMEPPYWYYPVHQSLGSVLLRAGRLDEAEQAFRASLAKAPNNAWSLYGLRQVYRKRGDAKAEREVARALRRAGMGQRTSLDLTRL